MSVDSESPDGPSPGEVRRLSILYIAALGAVAALTLGAQFLIQRQLTTGESDSQVINLAGRQRMLSQRLAKGALALRHSPAAPHRDVRDEFTRTLRLWSLTHDRLQHGHPEIGLPGENSPAITELFAAIEPHFQAIKSAAATLAQDPSDTRANSIIQKHESDFLSGMDAIVSQYVAEAKAKVARLRRLEYAILTLTLSVLLAEGLLIFRPAVRRIEQTVNRLAALSDRLRRARDEAQEANAAKTRFLANVSHELRTPMTAVLGMTELARQSRDDGRRTEYLQIAEEAGESLLKLLNDLIDLARIDAGKLRLICEPFDPQQVVDRVVAMMQPAAAEKGIRLRGTRNVNPWRCVCGDASRTQQVLVNFVANAIKSTDSGEVIVGCTAAAAGQKMMRIAYTVTDTGVGISPADQQRIFEPFTQLRRASAGGSPPPGAGLGLAICQRLATAMNAEINLQSAERVGTTITLAGEFPRAEALEPTAIARSPIRVVSPLEVLIVEDTPLIQILLRQQLAASGHTATIAGSVAEALAIFRTERFDLALIDYQLPDGDGAELAAQLTAESQRLGRTCPPLVCVTAHAGLEKEGAPEAEIFDAVLIKPLRRRELDSTIEALVGGPPDEEVHEASNEIPSGEGANWAELLSVYLENSPTQRGDLQAALDAGQWPRARVVAHRFRGQVPYFDQGDLAGQLAELESACRESDSTAISDLGPAILLALQALEHRLQTEASRSEQFIET